MGSSVVASGPSLTKRAGEPLDGNRTDVLRIEGCSLGTFVGVSKVSPVGSTKASASARSEKPSSLGRSISSSKENPLSLSSPFSVPSRMDSSKLQPANARVMTASYTNADNRDGYIVSVKKSSDSGSAVGGSNAFSLRTVSVD